MKARVALLAVACALALAPLPGAANGAAVVAGPGAYLTTYTTPVVTWSRDAGVPLTFVSTDLQGHDVVSDQTRDPGTAPWCPAGGPRCPLFFTDLIGLSRPTAPVLGLHDIEPGVYSFACSPHPWMTGLLVVV